jgi:hypothetical protein
VKGRIMKKRMKMKLLDYTLIGLLAGAAPLAGAQTTASVAHPAGDGQRPVDCSDEACKGEEGLLFRLRTRSYDKPVTHDTSEASSSPALQPDRRVTIATEQPGKATAMGKFSIDLPGGGVIWATEDPTLGQPELSVSAPTMIAFDGQRITKPVQFYVRGNYPAFIKRLEISLYRSSDADLIEPVATVPLDVAGVTQADWDGALPSRYPFRKGDELVYVLRAYGEGDSFDETYPRTLQLVSPEEAERGMNLLRDSAERALGTSLSSEQAQAQRQLDDVFSGNGLRQQNIPMYGSRIRIQGRNIPERAQLTINGEQYPVDLERKFVAEYLVPVGRHRFDIGVGDGQNRGAGSPATAHTLDVDVTGRYFFGVGLADVTIAQNKVSGSGAAFANDTRYQDDVISDGRLAFYGKAKYRGKYLVTAQADTTQRDLERLFNGFTEARPAGCVPPAGS